MATPPDFDTLVFFGDSLTDSGLRHRLLQELPDPFFKGRFSNGYNHADYLVQPVLGDPGVPLVPPFFPPDLPNQLGLEEASYNFAFGGAEAVTDPIDFETGQSQINLSAQVAHFVAGGVPPRTAAALFIGNDDYLNAFRSPTPPADEAEALALVGRVLASIDQAASTLTDAGVERVVLYTLPNLSVTPLGYSLPEAQRAAIDAVFTAHNTGLKLLAGKYALSGTDVTLADIDRLTKEVVADQETFGLVNIVDPLYIPAENGGLDRNPKLEGVDEDDVAFFDSIHPTTVAHRLVAAFEEATLRADFVHQRGDGDNTVLGLFGDEFILTGDGQDRVLAWGGEDVVFAGLGNDVVFAGPGNDLVALGSGADRAWGDSGTDLLAGNIGNDSLSGGPGDDVVLGGPDGDQSFGNAGNDWFLFTADGNGNPELVNGGNGIDTLRLSITENAFQSLAFQQAWTPLAAAASLPQTFTFESLNLTVSNIERVEVKLEAQPDSYWVGYAPDHTAGAENPAMSPTMLALLNDAYLWGGLI